MTGVQLEPQAFFTRQNLSGFSPEFCFSRLSDSSCIFKAVGANQSGSPGHLNLHPAPNMIEICGRAPGRVANAAQVTMGCVRSASVENRSWTSNDFSALVKPIPSQLLLDSVSPSP